MLGEGIRERIQKNHSKFPKKYKLNFYNSFSFLFSHDSIKPSSHKSITDKRKKKTVFRGRASNLKQDPSL